MNSHFFNTCLLLGWSLATAGGCLLNLGAGLVGGGLLLLLITAWVARIGGLYVPAKGGD